MNIQIIGGAGEVGSTIAFGLIITMPSFRIVLVDIDKKKLKSQHEDLKRARDIWGNGSMKIIKRNKPEPTADVHIICAGNRRNGDEEDRELYKRNIRIVDDILKQLHSGQVIIVTNPAEMLRNAVTVGHPRLNIIHAGDRCDNSGYSGASIMEGKNGITNFGITAEVLEMLGEM